MQVATAQRGRPRLRGEVVGGESVQPAKTSTDFEEDAVTRVENPMRSMACEPQLKKRGRILKNFFRNCSAFI